MRFSETLNTVDLVLEAKDVPLIIGEAGIGKTALVKELSRRTNSHLVTIDANLLKEGEIGGLPIVENRKTVYAIHNKLAEVEKLAYLEDDKNIILFIDELNRCEHAVQQELMNLILNREINGYYLADKVRVITAMNPSNKYESFESSDYQVVDMDAAQEDRFVWVEMEADVKAWIRWAMGQGNKVHGNIIEFISTFPEYLHTPYARNCLSFLESSRNEKNINIFSSILTNYPKDLRLGIMKEIKSDYSSELYKDLEVELNKDSLKDLTKKIAINAFKGKGPKDIQGIINSYTEKSEISWQDILKKLIPSLRAGQKKTITRRNRRQPERLELRGTLPRNLPEILVAIDISASMSDEEVYKIMIEILGITKTRSNKITVIECDNEVRRVYEIKSKSDIKKRLTNTGSTLFTPVFEYIKTNNLRNHVLIYFTDGVGEEELKVTPINANTIWVLTGDEELSLGKSYGEVKRINGKSNDLEVETSALTLIGEFIHEWAR